MLKRIDLAAKAGFTHVELAWPYDYSVSEFKRAVESSKVDVVLINTSPGKRDGDMGLAAVPGREDDFLYGMKQAIEYAQAVKCPSIHIMAGNILTQREKLDERQRIRSEYRSVMVNNLCKAVHLLDSAGIMGNLEPINTHISAPNYFLNLPEEAFSIIDEVESKTGKKRLVYQCDFFHLQVQQGNISRFLERNISKIGHFQVAQVPGRNEPDTDGELNYSFIFETIKKLGYGGSIGLEYAPKNDTSSGLKWLKDYSD